MNKVLVVENNPTILRLLVYHLELEGCEVTTATDGLSALVILDNEIPDILFTDIIMPKVSGDQLCRIVRESKELKDVFIAVYSSTTMEDNQQILDIDADVYIAKGTSTNLKEHIQHVLHQYKKGTRRVQTIIGSESLQSREITKELLLARKHYHAIFHSVEEAVIELDSSGKIVQANRAAQKLFNRDTIALHSLALMNFIQGPEKKDAVAWIQQERRSDSSSFNSRYDTPLLVNNRKVLLSMVSIKEQDESFIISILQDITLQKQTEEKLARTLGEFNAVIDTIDYGVLIMDPQLKARTANRAYRDMWGIPEELIDSEPSVRELMEYNRHNTIYDISLENFDSYIDVREEAIRTGAIAPMELRRSDGKVYTFQCVILPDGGRMLTYFDITSLKRTEEKLTETLEKVKALANHDPLTGLPNLRLAQERLRSAILLSKRNGLKVGIMFLDLDGFKEVNDSYGHSTGDKLLQNIADRLSKVLRETDTVSRIGGDEFLVIQTAVADRSAVAKVAEKIAKHISKPFFIEGREVSVSSSIGISIYPEHGEDFRVLLKKADGAMYSTKRKGKNSYTFTPD